MNFNNNKIIIVCQRYLDSGKSKTVIISKLHRLLDINHSLIGYYHELIDFLSNFKINYSENLEEIKVIQN